VAVNYHLLSQIQTNGHTTRYSFGCKCTWWHVSLIPNTTTCRSLKSNTHHM